MTRTPRTAGHRDRTSLFSDRASVALLVSGAITALTLGTAFGLLALDVEHFWIVFPVGFGVALPTALGVVIRTRTTTGTQDTTTGERESAEPLEELRTQYVRGEISEREFEHRLDRLIESDEM